MKIAGAIFDMDGTLLDSMEIWETIGEKYLISKGIVPDYGINQVVLSMPLTTSVGYIKRQYGLEDTEKQIRDDMEWLLEQFYREEVQVKEGVEELLMRLKNDGVKMCVATATSLPLAELALKKAGLYEYFQEILSCHSIHKSKAFPDIYELALKKLGTKKEMTVVFEDALYAAKTAKEAGFFLIGVHDISEREQKKLMSLADQFYISFADIIRCYYQREIKYDTKEDICQDDI